MKRFLSLCCLLLLLSALAGCRSPERTVTCRELTLTLPLTFADLSAQDYAKELDLIYGYEDVTVSAVRDDRAGLASFIPQLTLEEYGELTISLHELEAVLQEKDGFYTFTYEAEIQGEDVTYLSVVYESRDSFWTVQAYCPTELYSQYEAQMWQYVTSAKLS